MSRLWPDFAVVSAILVAAQVVRLIVVARLVDITIVIINAHGMILSVVEIVLVVAGAENAARAVLEHARLALLDLRADTATHERGAHDAVRDYHGQQEDAHAPEERQDPGQLVDVALVVALGREGPVSGRVFALAFLWRFSQGRAWARAVEPATLIRAVDHKELVVRELDVSVHANGNDHREQILVGGRLATRPRHAAVGLVRLVKHMTDVQVVLERARALDCAQGLLALVSRVNDAEEGLAGLDVDARELALASVGDKNVKSIAVLKDVGRSRAPVARDALGARLLSLLLGPRSDRRARCACCACAGCSC